MRRVDVRALDVLLMPIAGRNGIRVVGHQGIQIDNLNYMPSNILVGTQVFCRHHPDDLGQIYVYTPDGRQFLDIAICPEMSGQNPAEVAKLLMAKVNGLVAERKKELQAEIRQIKRDRRQSSARTKLISVALKIVRLSARISFRCPSVKSIIQHPQSQLQLMPLQFHSNQTSLSR
ncbi:hypothetical protein DEA98_13505 [Brucella pseudogrignonensis]|nr:hypothetical protein [Brucella pseudogrignonensis]